MIYERYLKCINATYIYLDVNNCDILLELCDCFILPGGDDLNPDLYNEDNISSDNVYDEIDSLDYKILEYAVNTNKKVLGICRGIQSINVYFNGSLTQHFPNHSNTEHVIVKENDSKYINLENKLIVNSYHHQIINKLGENLKVLFRSADGCIEVIEHDTLPIIGVQFHPEIQIYKHFKVFDFLIFQN